MSRSALTLLFVTIITGIFCISRVTEAAKGTDSSGPANSISLTPTIGGYFFADSDQYQPAFMYGVRLGYDIAGASIADSLGIEATYNHFSAASENNSGSADADLFRLDAFYPIFPRNKVVPFLALGVGGIAINAAHSETNPLLNYGAGVKYFFESNLALRLDARHVLVYDNVDTHNNFEFSAGVSYYFGREPKKSPVPIVDLDQDGVPDSLDKCQDTPKGNKVDRYGCPPDRDKDGVPDHLDKCPDTPVGVPVDPDGCPRDGKKKSQQPAPGAGE